MKLLPQLSCSCVVTTHAMATALAHFGWKMEGHRSAFLGHLAGMKLGKALDGASIRNNVSPIFSEPLWHFGDVTNVFIPITTVYECEVCLSLRYFLTRFGEPNQVMVVRPQTEKDKFTAFVVARVRHLGDWEQMGSDDTVDTIS